MVADQTEEDLWQESKPFETPIPFIIGVGVQNVGEIMPVQPLNAAQNTQLTTLAGWESK